MRPHSHVLETESRDRFVSAVVPSEWVRYPLSPDYGFDLLLWPFKENQPLGHFINVQLKATSRPGSTAEHISIRFATDTLELYARTHAPVVIVVWVKDEDAFYWLDAKAYLEDLTRTEGSAWRKRKSTTVLVPTSQRLRSKEDAESWADALPPSGPLDLIRTEAETARNIWKAAVEAAVEGRLGDLNAKVRTQLGLGKTGASVAKRIRDALTERGPVVFHPVEDGFKVTRPTLEGVLVLLEYGGPGALDFLVKFAWLPDLDPEEVAKLLAFATRKGQWPPHALNSVFDVAPSTYILAIQFLLSFAPEICRDVPNTIIDTKPWSPGPNSAPTAIFYRLRFEESQIASRLAEEVNRTGDQRLELVRVGPVAYMIITEVIEPAPAGDFYLGFIQGRGPADGHNLTFRSGPMPRRIRFVKVLARLPDTATPFGIIYYPGPTQGFPTIAFGDATLSQTGGQEGYARVAAGGRRIQWFFEGFMVLEQFQFVKPSDTPQSIPGRKRVTLRATKSPSDVIATGFFMLDEPLVPVTDLLGPLRSRYAAVDEP